MNTSFKLELNKAAVLDLQRLEGAKLDTRVLIRVIFRLLSRFQKTTNIGILD
jgi:hypothetical protein